MQIYTNKLPHTMMLKSWTGEQRGIAVSSPYSVYINDEGKEVFLDDNRLVRETKYGTWSVPPCPTPPPPIRKINEDKAQEPVLTFVPSQPTFTTKEEIPNPKKAMGQAKAPLHAYPMLSVVQMANVMAGGAHKYGIFNYRESKVDALTYIGAIQRHFMKWCDGVDIDSESGQSELAHIMACCSILIDAMSTGSFIDNRSKTGLMEEALKQSEKTFAEFVKNNKSWEERNG